MTFKMHCMLEVPELGLSHIICKTNGVCYIGYSHAYHYLMLQAKPANESRTVVWTQILICDSFLGVSPDMDGCRYDMAPIELGATRSLCRYLQTGADWDIRCSSWSAHRWEQQYYKASKTGRWSERAYYAIDHERLGVVKRMVCCSARLGLPEIYKKSNNTGG
jgi:hypothetical protein